VENIYEELDAPGEWFYDDESRLLHLMVNGTDAPPRSLWGTRLANLITIQGSMDRPVCTSAGGQCWGGRHDSVPGYWLVFRTQSQFISKCSWRAGYTMAPVQFDDGALF
jgi:hypothetical protein